MRHHRVMDVLDKIETDSLYFNQAYLVRQSARTPQIVETTSPGTCDVGNGSITTLAHFEHDPMFKG